MATGDQGVSGGFCINIKGRLTTQPQWHIRTLLAAHGTLSYLALNLHLGVPSSPPAVVAMHVAACQIGPGLLIARDVLSTKAGESQRVEAHGTLRAASVQLLSQRLQVFQGGSERQPLSGSPKQGGTTEVNERTIYQLIGRRLHLKDKTLLNTVNNGSQKPDTLIFSWSNCFSIMRAMILKRPLWDE